MAAVLPQRGMVPCVHFCVQTLQVGFHSENRGRDISILADTRFSYLCMADALSKLKALKLMQEKMSSWETTGAGGTRRF